MIYLDNAATAKPLASAVDKANVFINEQFYNPSALYHGGIYVQNQLKTAKNTILQSLGTTKHDVIFTSCGTEADNQAILSVCKRGVFITTEGEHSAVYKCAMELKNRGLTVEFVKLNPNGSVNVNDLLEKVKNLQPTLVSIVHVNNETGAINNVNYIAEQIKKLSPKTIIHSDGVQAFCKIKYTLSKSIDLYSISAHKIGGLKGTGALIKSKTLNLPAFIFGGGQENNLRSGTENVFGIKVFEYATIERQTNIQEYFEHVTKLSNYAREHIDNNFFKIISDDICSPYILTISAIGLRGEVVMHKLEEENIIIGNGSACSSKNPHSRIISACGYKNDILDGIIRLSFSPYDSLEDISIAIDKLNSTVEKLRKIML